MAAKKKPGPDADRLNLTGDWQDAMKRAVAIERPAKGWPKPDGRYKGRKRCGNKKAPKP